MSCEAIPKEQELAQPFSSLASRSSILPALPPAGLPGETLSAIGVPCHVAADQVMSWSSMYEVRAARTRQELRALQQRVFEAIRQLADSRAEEAAALLNGCQQPGACRRTTPAL